MVDNQLYLTKEHEILNLKNSNKLLLKEITSYEHVYDLTNNKNDICDIYNSIKLRVLGIKEGKNDEMYDLTENIKDNIKQNVNYNVYYDIQILNNSNKHFNIKLENLYKLRKFEILEYT